MPPRITLWEVDGENLSEIRARRLDLESRLEDWLERHISLVGEDLLIIVFGTRLSLIRIREGKGQPRTSKIAR